MASESFTNDASLNYWDKSLPAHATVSVSERSDLIEKSGKPISGGDQILWTIDVNKPGSVINNAIVEDDLPEFTTLTPDSIEVYQLIKDGDNWTETKLDLNYDKFPLELGDIGSGARRIKFKTDIDYTQLNGGIYKGTNIFLNETNLKDGETPLDEDSATVTTQRESIITKNGTANINYDTKEINWTISVNKANHKIGDAIVTDVIPAGLELKLDSVKVFEGTATGNDVTETKTIIKTIDKLEVKLGDITTEHTITFTTSIEDFEVGPYKNVGTIVGTGVGVGDGDIDNTTVTPTQNSFNKKFDSINYINKTMSWSLEVNPILKAISELKIIDTFPNKGLILLKDTVAVTLGDDMLTEGIDYDLTERTVDGITGYHFGFEINFKGPKLPLNNKINISYDTSFDPNKIVDANTSIDGVYKNKAQFVGKTDNEVEFDTEREDDNKLIDNAWNTGHKKGKLISKDKDDNFVNGWISGNERHIEWTVYANFLEQNLKSINCKFKCRSFSHF